MFINKAWFLSHTYPVNEWSNDICARRVNEDSSYYAQDWKSDIYICAHTQFQRSGS